MHDSPNKALERVVTDLGGSKVVAPLLWPDKPLLDAQRLLCDCLNDDRPAKLDFSQVLFILRLAKDKGKHDGMTYIADFVGYSHPTPIEPEDEVAALQREFNAQVSKLESLADRIGKFHQIRRAA